MNTQHRANLLRKIAGVVTVVSACASIAFPGFAVDNPYVSIFNPATIGPTRSPDGTIAGEFESAIVRSWDFQAIARAFQSAGLIERLRAKDQKDPEKVLFTVFVPTDKAFEALPAGTLENPERRTKILNYHLVSGNITGSHFNAGVVKTLEGGNVKIKSNGPGNQLVLNDEAKVTSSIRVQNGVIVFIDKVLLPPDLQ